MKNKRTLSIAITAFILTAIAAFGLFRYLPQTVKAFDPQPDPPAFGIFGITEGQTARVNVVNTAEPRDGTVPPGPCRVVITFRNAAGGLFTRPDGTPLSRTVELGPEQSTFLMLNADNFGREASGRLQLRPDVKIQQSDPVNGVPPGPCIPTIEVINNATGRTQFVFFPPGPPTRVVSTNG